MIITTYNGASRGYLSEAIESVLNQTFKDFELIIVDDGSTDNTKLECKKFLTNPRVKYIYQENKGPAGARNTGIKNSEGRYICFLDDDDIWEKGKLEKQLDFYENKMNSNIGLLFTCVKVINEKNEHIGVFSNTAEGYIYDKMFYFNQVNATSSVMIREDVFKKVGYFREDPLLKGCEDYEMWLRIAKDFQIYSLNEALVTYRRHRDKLSNDRKKIEFAQFLALYYALENDTSIDENKVYNYLFKQFAINYYNLRDYTEYRKYFKIASAYGNLGIKLTIKYYFPKFIYLLKLLKAKIKGLIKNTLIFKL